jgi:hypothetical protein
MRTQRTKALLAVVGAFLLAAVGVLLAPGAASAAPDYPPPPSTVSVSAGTVRAGNSVGVYGTGFGEREPVVVQTRFRPRSGYWFPSRGIVVHKHIVWTNKDGEFKTRVRTSLPGKLIIHARGLESGESGSATVRVIGRHIGHGGYGDWYDMGLPGMNTPHLPGMQAVHNTVGRWVGAGSSPGRHTHWMAQ